jgi:hypothetical protein
MPKEVEVRSLSSIVAAIGTNTPTYLPKEIHSNFSELFLILLYSIILYIVVLNVFPGSPQFCPLAENVKPIRKVRPEDMFYRWTCSVGNTRSSHTTPMGVPFAG